MAPSRNMTPRRPTILYLFHELPFPVDAGHKARAVQIIESLSDEFDLIVAGPTEESSGEAEAFLLAGFPAIKRVIASDNDIRLRRRPLKLASVIGGALAQNAPYTTQKFWNARFANELRALSARGEVDAVLSSIQMTQYTRFFKGVATAIDSHNIEHQLWDDFAIRENGVRRLFAKREIRLLRHVELDAWRKAQAVIAICREDADIISTLTKTPTYVLPPMLRPEGSCIPPLTQADVGLIGRWSWAPNEVAIEYFARELAPSLHRLGFSMRVAGPGLSRAIIRELEATGVEVTGYLTSLASFYESVRCVVAPYFVGGGVRMKVLEAMAYGVPLVGTPLAFRGLTEFKVASRACATADDMIALTKRTLENYTASKEAAEGLALDVLRQDGDQMKGVAASMMKMVLGATGHQARRMAG